MNFLDVSAASQIAEKKLFFRALNLGPILRVARSPSPLVLFLNFDWVSCLEDIGGPLCLGAGNC